MSKVDRLRAQLEGLGLIRGARGLTPVRRRKGKGIEACIEGEVLETDAGTCFAVEARFPPDYAHGRIHLGALLEQDAEHIKALAEGDPPAGEVLSPYRILFLDTETTGLGTGAGTYAFLVGTGSFEADGTFVIRQLFLRDINEEPAQMSTLAGIVPHFGGLGSFNGRTFDIPLLETRMTLQRLSVPFRRLPHLDLLLPARRVWREALPSCALSSLETAVLGVRRTSADVPGRMIPSLYYDYLSTGDAAPLAGVFYHNQQDILSTVALAARLGELLAEPETAPQSALEALGLARFLERLGRVTASERAYRHAMKMGLPATYHQQVERRLGKLLKRARQPEKAAELWEEQIHKRQGRRFFDVEPFVELAKFHEWQTKDYQKALDVTEQARAEAAGWHSSPVREKTLAELEHRRRRLRRKLGLPEDIQAAG